MSSSPQTHQQKHKRRVRLLYWKSRSDHIKTNEYSKELDKSVASMATGWSKIPARVMKILTDISNGLDTNMRKRLPRRELKQIIHRALTARYPQAYYRLRRDHRPVTGVHQPYNVSKVDRDSVGESLRCGAYDPDLGLNECSSRSADTELISKPVSLGTCEVSPAAVKSSLTFKNRSQERSKHLDLVSGSITRHDDFEFYSELNDELMDELRVMCEGSDRFGKGQVTGTGSHRLDDAMGRYDDAIRRPPKFKGRLQHRIAAAMRHCILTSENDPFLRRSYTYPTIMANLTATTTSSAEKRDSFLLRDIDSELALLRPLIPRRKRVQLVRPDYEPQRPPAPRRKPATPYDLQAKLMLGDLPLIPCHSSEEVNQLSQPSLWSHISLPLPAATPAPAAGPSPTRPPHNLLARLNTIRHACRDIFRRRGPTTAGHGLHIQHLGPTVPVAVQQIEEILSAPAHPSQPQAGAHCSQCVNAQVGLSGVLQTLGARRVSWDSGVFADSVVASTTPSSSDGSPIDDIASEVTGPGEEGGDFGSSLPSHLFLTLEAGGHARNRRYVNRGFI
ncbi:hypothetical protein MYU51_011163 [Penicillium brevicompactum]